MIYDLKTEKGSRIFNGDEIYKLHDYIAICLNSGRHLVLKDRYENVDLLNGYSKSTYPYVMPYFMFDGDVVEELILSGKYKIREV